MLLPFSNDEEIPNINFALQYVDCPIVGDYSADGELLMMRCLHGALVNPADPAECAGVLKIQCGKSDYTLDIIYMQLNCTKVTYTVIPGTVLLKHIYMLQTGREQQFWPSESTT